MNGRHGKSSGKFESGRRHKPCGPTVTSCPDALRHLEKQRETDRRHQAGIPAEFHGSRAANPRGDSADNFRNNAGSSLAALVLAGGRAKRVGGGDKPMLPVAGRPMLDQILEDLLAQRCARVVVVGPDRLPVPPGVELTLEDPPFGGPVAGIIAGLCFLSDTVPDLVAILAGDSPAGAVLIPALVAGLHTYSPRVSAGDSPAGKSVTTPSLTGIYDGCVVRHSSGFRQYLCGVYRFAALASRAHEVGTDAGRDMSVRRFFQPLNLAEISDTQNLSRDFDTWEDINSVQ